MKHADEKIQGLIKILNNKYILLNDILKLSNNQTNAIRNEEMDKLNSIITTKQFKINKVDNLDEKFTLLFNNIKNHYKVEELSELEVGKKLLLELKKSTKKVFETLNQINQVEKKNKELINKSYQQVKAKLKNVKQGKKMTSNYYKKAPQTGGYFIDNKK